MKPILIKARLFSLLLFIFLLSACQKEAGNNICSIDTASLTGSYKLIGMVYKRSSTAPEEDYLVLREPCEQDDIIEFVADGSLHYKDLGSICEPGGSYTSSWSISQGSITIDGDVGVIKRFDCAELVVEGYNMLTSGDMITFTYKKQ